MVKKKESEEIKDFLKGLIFSKKFQIGLTIIIFLVILISSTSIRLSNVEILKDRTNGEYLSNDLDSFYFYRVAETKLRLGSLPEIDSLRSPGYNVSWIPELIDDYLVWNYKILKIFNPEITFNYATTISAPIFFAIGLVLFFILCLLLTKSRTASLLASAFLAYSPAFLFRSISGFYDHDHVGVFALFVLMIAGVFSFRYCEKNWRNSILFGIALGFFTALVLTSWGGAITFVMVFLPLALLLHYMFNVEDKNKFLVFYLCWVVFSVVFTPILGAPASWMHSRFLDSQGILVLFVFGFALIDSLVVRYWKKFSFVKENQVSAYSFGLTIVLGLIGLSLIGKNPITLFRKAWATLIYPFFGEFGGRLSATVAENAQPYLTDLINQNGQLIFGFFILGLGFLCWNFLKHSESLLSRVILSCSMIFLLLAILFSRISSTSLLNGENFISQGLYLLGGITFLAGLGYVYIKKKCKIEIEHILMFSIALTVAINARAAIRSFFLITPFICLIGAYGLVELFKKVKETKDEDFKIVGWIVGILVGGLVLISLFGNPVGGTPGKYQIASSQAQYVGASANVQWQNSMEWVRDETPEDSIFVHWWDYGYFVQTMGKRATVTDGGHSGGDHADHYIGRYVLTTPNPQTALSFMKTWDVDYLLIDPTEMGKYGAFSKIGSDDSWDRLSAGIFGGVSDDSQIQETAEGITRIYQVGGCVDEDISYSDGTSKIFLPGISITKTQGMECNSYLLGIIIDFVNSDSQMRVKQPEGVFLYNNKQYKVPLKNLFIGGEMISFEDGIDSVVYLIPKIDDKTAEMNTLGAMIYLSPRTFNSLMGRLYILDDYYNEYPTLSEAHYEDDPAVSYFKQFTGGNLNEFIWYGGLRAPLKIWKVDYPAGTPVHEEFLGFERKLEFGGLDYLFE